MYKQEMSLSEMSLSESNSLNDLLYASTYDDDNSTYADDDNSTYRIPLDFDE